MGIGMPPACALDVDLFKPGPVRACARHRSTGVRHVGDRADEAGSAPPCAEVGVVHWPSAASREARALALKAVHASTATASWASSDCQVG